MRARRALHCAKSVRLAHLSWNRLNFEVHVEAVIVQRPSSRNGGSLARKHYIPRGALDVMRDCTLLFDHWDRDGALYAVRQHVAAMVVVVGYDRRCCVGAIAAAVMLVKNYEWRFLDEKLSRLGRSVLAVCKL